ncbi:hypothetical protein ABB37_00971 [Leptomonas pyrrhocoris]|uniref:Uncharacterized protein n=1 Tax=Leptomonas pyrrhocoris TaxID=157538 RepID=A0A0N0VIB0_LEPPY|nr:hypothetical protein ABB37_00971 [Leptomonas pyrrhocoris]KPA86944.1 hypothetical protein ABB37_00971 [Leptomonas pyrrhocoris]|eukprot:XP_015665383.1 hypothetical protein ABB37_00971 [Leptomonas pyrrhocoris]
MDFSSSSDSDLEEELNRNFRRERREQGGIVRTASSARSEARRYTLPDGHSIEVRRGCIYIPFREIYVHVLQALCCPQKWFGDGRIPCRRRKPLSPDLVSLIRVSDLTSSPRRDEVIALADATENGFFIFAEVRDISASPSSPPFTEPQCHSLQSQKTFDPFVDTRFQRIMQLSRWRFTLKHSPALKEYRHDVWSSSEVPRLSHEVCCYDDDLGLLWKFDGQDGALYMLRYTEATAAFSQTLFATIPFPPQVCLQMQYLPGKEDEHAFHTVQFHLVIIGVSHVAIASLSINRDQSSDAAVPQASLQHVQTVALCLSDAACGCTRAHNSTCELPDLWLGAGRSIFKFAQRDSGDWSKSRVTSFSTTDVTALAVQAAGTSTLGFTVAGMRNGTLQLVADGVRRHAKFDTTVRHHGSDIKFVFEIPDVPYGFVSIARNGETKVWDARLLSQEKDPVRTLLKSRPDGGQAGVCSAALAGNVLAVSSASTGLTCVDIPLYTTLLHTVQNISSSTRIVLGTRNGIFYDLYTFSPYFVQRFELCS